MKKSRKGRKLEAKQNGIPFTPQYNGTGVVTYEDYYGQGIERFNNKFIQFLKPVEEDEIVPEIETELEKVEVIETTSFEKSPKKKKGKIKKALKKLFNK